MAAADERCAAQFLQSLRRTVAGQSLCCSNDLRRRQMLDHVSIGVRNIAKAKLFYDAALGALGYRRLREAADLLGYGADSPRFWISPTDHPVDPDMRTGLHFCFTAPDRESVDAFYKQALEAGGRDNGKPGIRDLYAPDYYAAFVIDPDGYRIEAYCGGQ
jgi:catechol 2,3-dioxygenase-like lactoylglutathione lyase family enzyme